MAPQPPTCMSVFLPLTCDALLPLSQAVSTTDEGGVASPAASGAGTPPPTLSLLTAANARVPLGFRFFGANFVLATPRPCCAAEQTLITRLPFPQKYSYAPTVVNAISNPNAPMHLSGSPSES